MTRTELEKLRDTLRTMKGTVLAVRDAREPLDALSAVATAVDELLVLSDPDQRPVTEIGGRILEAGLVVGLDAFRLEQALHDQIPAGTLTRLLYHPSKKIRVDVLTRVAELIGCELEWLQFARGEKRTRPVPLGVKSARMFGATEDAIRTVLARDAKVDDRDDNAWTMAFLEESKRLQTEPASEESSTRLR